MIIVIAVMLICSFILAVSWWFEVRKTKALSSQNVSLQNDLTITASELVRIKDSFRSLTEEIEADQGFGTHIKWHNVQRATANTYRLVFDLDIRGREIIEDLVIRFKRNAFVSDQNGGERETARRLGRQEVIDFILNRCNTATDPRYSEELELLEQQQND